MRTLKVDISNENSSGDGWSLHWDRATAILSHSLGVPESYSVEYDSHVMQGTGGGEVSGEAFDVLSESNMFQIALDEPLPDGVSIALSLSFKEPDDVVLDDGTLGGGEFYSGFESDVLLLCKSLKISDGRLAQVTPSKIRHYQRLVDNAIDGYLSEYYFTPIRKYNQVDRDGHVGKVFPGKLRLMALQWTVGLMMQAEFQNLEPNQNEQAVRFQEDAMREMQQLTLFNMRIPGQRNKSALSKTFPPNMQPPQFTELML